MPSLDNISSLIYLKDKARKWKNIAILVAIFSSMLFAKLVFGNKLSGMFSGEDCIANIRISGVIFEDDFRSKILKQIAAEKSIKALIVNIDSPGGGIVGSEILFNNLREIADNKPVVAVMESVAASGAYMAAIAADYIVAHNGTITGSIGVIMELPEVTELADKLGIKVNAYKSSPIKGSPSPFEKSNVAVDNIVNASIADSHLFFTELVKARRGDKLDVKAHAVIFDGRIFTGRQALRVGLVDKVGSERDAISYLSENKIDTKLPIKDIEIVEREKKFFEKFFSFLPFFDLAKGGITGSGIMAVMR